MDEKRDELKTALRALAEEARRDLGAHVRSEELIAYHHGTLSAEDEQRVQDHLVMCRECTSLLLDLAAFPALDQQGARQLSDVEVTAAWQRIQPQLQQEEGRDVSRRRWWLRIGAVSFPMRLSYALAASLLVVSLALGGWILSLRRENQKLAAHLNEQLAEREQAVVAATKSLEEARRQLEETTRRSEQSETQIAELRQTVDELSQPQLNIPIADLYPRDYIRGQERAVKTIEVPSGANLFTVILNVANQRSYASYALDIVAQRGPVVWQGQGLQKSSFGNFTIALSRRLFPAGQYQIKLYGLSQGRRELVEDYALRIRYQ